MHVDSLAPGARLAVDRANRLAYPPAEAAALLGVSRATLYKLITDGTIPSLSIGRSRRIRHQAIVAYLDRLEVAQGVA